jgi:DNA-binding GntR family transcriptional regulator
MMSVTQAIFARWEKPDGKATSLVDRAYEEIKHRISTVAYAPGAYLNETIVSQDLQIGRTPVHQALQLLAKEGLVDVVPRKGVFVRPVSLDEITQLLEVRLLTEPFCASLAAQRASRSDLAEPKAILAAAQREINRDQSVEMLMLLDRQFHSWITRVAGNAVLADILGQLQDRSARFWFLSLSKGRHRLDVQAEHVEILRAIATRDAELAAQKARDHIESFRNTILSVV